MRILLILIALIAVIGGGIFGLMKSGVLPFGKREKPTSKTAVKPRSSEERGAISARPSPVSPRPASAESPSPARPRPENRDGLSAEEARKVQRLASIYEQMSPEDAARIMARLPDSLVEEMLRRMDERQAGQLLIRFPLDRAARLTRALAH